MYASHHLPVAAVFLVLVVALVMLLAFGTRDCAQNVINNSSTRSAVTAS
jgi:hypothetical protein